MIYENPHVLPDGTANSCRVTFVADEEVRMVLMGKPEPVEGLLDSIALDMKWIARQMSARRAWCLSMPRTGKLQRQLDRAMAKYQSFGEWPEAVWLSDTGQHLLDRWRDRIDQISAQIDKRG